MSVLAAPKHGMVGYGHFETGVAFALWMAARRTEVTYRDVMAEFECCEATAQRWLNKWERAAGKFRVRKSVGRRASA